MEEDNTTAQATFKLPARLDTHEAPVLKKRILEAYAEGGASVQLDASAVEYVGGLCLQVILASHAPVIACSEKASEAFTLFGVRSQLCEATS